MATLTKKRARALIKATRAQGRRPSAKLMRAARTNPRRGRRRARRLNPGTAFGAAKARRIRSRRAMIARHAEAAVYRRKRTGAKVTVRARAGKRKSNRRWGRRYGISTGRRGTIGFHYGRGRGRTSLKTIATNPRRRRRIRRARRNPARRARAMTIRGWQQGVMGLPRSLPQLFQGKNMVPNLGFATAGAATSLVVGGMINGMVMNMLGQVAPGLLGNNMVRGVLGGAITYTGGYVAGSMLIKNTQRRAAFITGAAAAAVINLLMPGQVARLLISIPIIGPQLARMPGMMGLGAYVTAPAYQGIGSYVTAPAYQGVGAYNDAVAGLGYGQDALAGELGAYVTAPAYQGVGMFDQSHLDQ